MKQTLLKTCSKPFKCKTSDSATTSQEFQEKKTTKTKQRTPSDKQEKHILKTLWKALDKHLQVLNHSYTKKDHNQVKAWN